MATGDLTSLARARQYLRIDPANTGDDSMIAGLVSSQSRWLKTQTGRELAYRSYVEHRNGTGTIGYRPISTR